MKPWHGGQIKYLRWKVKQGGQTRPREYPKQGYKCSSAITKKAQTKSFLLLVYYEHFTPHNITVSREWANGTPKRRREIISKNDKKSIDKLSTVWYNRICYNTTINRLRAKRNVNLFEFQERNHYMYINTKVEKYQGELPKNKFYKFTKITKCNNVIDVIRMTHEPKCVVKRLKDKTYVNIKSGEVKEYMPKIEGKQFRNIRSLKMIFRNLRQLITTNYQGGDNEIFLTMTYREQTNDPNRIYKDLDIFNKRLKRALPNVGYIHIVEPHGSGNYHVHSLIKDVTGTPIDFMDYKQFHKMWGQGYVTVEALNNVDNIGAYFIAYFSNLELTDEEAEKYAAEDDIKEKNGKKYIKGKRLDFYPDYMKIYRNSKNLKQPETITDIDEDEYKQSYEATYKITSTDDNGNESDSYIKKEQHKKAPSK